MRGRAYLLWKGLRDEQRAFSPCCAFTMARFILRARVVPESITPDLDDPELERHLEDALLQMRDCG
jgi:hypothetical protein